MLGTYAFWTARLKDMRAALMSEMEDTLNGKCYPKEYSCVIYTLMSHLHGENFKYIGWTDKAKDDVRELLKMKFLFACYDINRFINVVSFMIFLSMFSL